MYAYQLGGVRVSFRGCMASSGQDLNTGKSMRLIDFIQSIISYLFKLLTLQKVEDDILDLARIPTS